MYGKLKKKNYEFKSTDCSKKDPKCAQNKQRAFRLCVSNNCSFQKNVLMCGNGDCNCEKKFHAQCKSFMNFNYLSNTIRQFHQQVTKIYEPVINSLTRIIEDLVRSLNEIQEEMRTFMMPKQLKDMIHSTDRNELNHQTAIKLKKFFSKYKSFKVNISKDLMQKYNQQAREKIQIISKANKQFLVEIKQVLKVYDEEFKENLLLTNIQQQQKKSEKNPEKKPEKIN